MDDHLDVVRVNSYEVSHDAERIWMSSGRRDCKRLAKNLGSGEILGSHLRARGVLKYSHSAFQA